MNYIRIVNLSEHMCGKTMSVSKLLMIMFDAKKPVEK